MKPILRVLPLVLSLASLPGLAKPKHADRHFSPEPPPPPPPPPGEDEDDADDPAPRASGSREYERGMEAHQDEDFQAAADHWRRAYDAGYRRGPTAYNLACAYSQLGQTDDAFSWLQKSVDAGFDVQGYLDSDDDLDNLRDLPRFRELRRKAREERSQRRSGRASRAAERLHELESRKSDDPGRFDGVGRELLEDGRYADAARAFQREAELSQGSKSTPLYNAACALSLGGDKRGALDALQRAIEEGYDDPEHMERDGDLDNVRGEARYKELHALAEDLSMPGGMWGGQRGASKAMWRAAADHFSKLASAHPKMGRVFFSLGSAQLYAGDYDASAKSFEKSAQLGHRPGASLYNQACAQARAGQKDRAFESLRKAMDAGFVDADHFRRDDDLASLRGDPRFRDLIKSARDREERDGHAHFGGGRNFRFDSRDFREGARELRDNLRDLGRRMGRQFRWQGHDDDRDDDPDDDD